MANVEFNPASYLRTPQQVDEYNRHIKDKVFSRDCWINLNDLKEFPCIQIFSQHRLDYFLSFDLPTYPNLVRVFYTNIQYPTDTPGAFLTEVNGISLSITPKVINKLIRTSRPNTIMACSNRQFRNLPGLTEQQAMDFVLQDALVPHTYPHIHSLKKVDLGFNMQVFTEIVQSSLLPRKGHIDTVNILDIWVMGALGLGIPLDIGYLICRYMQIARTHPQQSLPYGSLISQILHKHNVPIADDEPSFEILPRNHISLATFHAKQWEKVDGQWRIKPKRAQGEASTSKRPRVDDGAPAAASASDAGPSGSHSHLEEHLDLIVASIGSLSDSFQSFRTSVETSFSGLDRRLDALERKMDTYFGD